MNINKILVGLCLALGTGALQSCEEDVMSELTSLKLDRALSPTGITATVTNKTAVRLTWTAIGGAKAYRAEIFETEDFSGTAVKTVDSITVDKLPYTITGLAGETKYYARVRALGSGNEDSKWVTASFTTDAEQIFKEVDLTKLTANSVTLNWPVGEIATSLTLAPGNITRNVTAAEIAAGEVTISGLTGETTYTAKLYNGTKTRGTKTFTTLIDLGGAIKVTPADNLATILASAVGGETYALMPGTYTVNGDVIVSKSISIKGAKPTDKPIITGMALKIKGNAGVSLKDLVISGPGTTSTTLPNYAMSYDEASDNAYGVLNVQDCEIKDYPKGVLSVNVKALIEGVVMKGNLIHDIECNGADAIDFRTGIAKTFLFENNTVYKVASSSASNSRDFFRMDAQGGLNFGSITSAITIKNNTFNYVSNSTINTTGTGNRIVYIRLGKHTIDVVKNIFSNTNAYYTNQSTTVISSTVSNNYFNAPNFLSQVVASSKFDATPTRTTLDPGFANAAGADFTISNQSLKDASVGDPRWIK